MSFFSICHSIFTHHSVCSWKEKRENDVDWPWNRPRKDFVFEFDDRFHRGLIKYFHIYNRSFRLSCWIDWLWFTSLYYHDLKMQGKKNDKKKDTHQYHCIIIDLTLNDWRGEEEKEERRWEWLFFVGKSIICQTRRMKNTWEK